MQILVTGGAGYIGSHTVKLLTCLGHKVTVIDNLSRGHRKALEGDVEFENICLLDYEKLLTFFEKHSFDAVIHFAAYAYVGESVLRPDMYYSNNVIGSLNLLKAMVSPL